MKICMGKVAAFLKHTQREQVRLHGTCGFGIWLLGGFMAYITHYHLNTVEHFSLAKDTRMCG